MWRNGPSVRDHPGWPMAACAYVLLVTFFLSIWQLRVTGRLSVTALVVFALLAVLSLAYGRLLTRLTVPSSHAARDLTVQFLSGYLLLNTLLALLSLVFPFGIVTSALIVAVGALVLGFFCRVLAHKRKHVGNLTHPRRLMSSQHYPLIVPRKMLARAEEFELSEVEIGQTRTALANHVQTMLYHSSCKGLGLYLKTCGYLMRQGEILPVCRLRHLF